MVPTERRCPRCGEVKPIDDFYRQSTARGGRGGYCRPCHRTIGREWEAANRRQSNDRKRRWDSFNAPPCTDCGIATSDPRSLRCAPCQHQHAFDEAWGRTCYWLGLRRQGVSNKQIAQRVGVSLAVVATVLCRTRVARFSDLEWLPSPYAAKRGVGTTR